MVGSLVSANAVGMVFDQHKVATSVMEDKSAVVRDNMCLQQFKISIYIIKCQQKLTPK